jgi:alpha-beta hydrolase superfamily lysophospholipase
MAEYANRYKDFAQAFTEKGYGVYINDMMGHGKSISSDDELGYLPEGGFDAAVEDLHYITGKIKEEYPGTPIFLLGHSMGSFLAQSYICKFGKDIQGCVLSGTAGKNSAAGMGAFLASVLKTIYGPKHRSKLLDNMSFGSYNNSFKPNRTKFDWLSRNNEAVDKYVEDPLCGFICTNSFFLELTNGLKKLQAPAALMNVPKNLPIYIMGGDSDPVGQNTKSVLQLIKVYKDLEIKNIEYKFYKDGRHEMLNELNKEEAYEDIVDWLDKKIGIRQNI